MSRILLAACLALVPFLTGCLGSTVLLRESDTPDAVAPEQARAARVGRFSPGPSGMVPNRFDAECERFSAIAVQQETDVWCWAACAQMIHKYYGRDVPQAEIAEKIHKRNADGSVNVQSAGLDEIVVALNFDLKERWDQYQAQRLENIGAGKGGSVRTDLASYINSYIDQYAINSDDLVSELQSNTPLVIGLSASDTSLGHACVVTGATYGIVTPSLFDQWVQKSQSVFGRYPKAYCLDEIHYVDPWDGQHKSLSGSEFKQRVDFMVSKRQARDILEQRLKAIQFH
ncbi:MAG: papain-like cysteine protease family protein [Phycisphaerales bacterium]